ncbi:hypothetical protein [Streptomyces afghaniensis]|uniref:hypothetical protein n=1 Tax=Streptomyces afghaniensis TaxID=66865 RepID=UPI00277FDCFE|nr:hypothetical protein [Streptomyces afghaniensis]MDQ1022239.1 hypothetical protein [Streptomyces afghaniensis]
MECRPPDTVLRAQALEGQKDGPAVAVCSLQDDPELWSLKVRTTDAFPAAVT